MTVLPQRALRTITVLTRLKAAETRLIAPVILQTYTNTGAPPGTHRNDIFPCFPNFLIIGHTGQKTYHRTLFVFRAARYAFSS